MTDAQRRAAIRAVIQKRTKAAVKSKAAARKALIEEGIYTRNGNLRREFGGKTSKENA